jgi:hypothetical protein
VISRFLRTGSGAKASAPDERPAEQPCPGLGRVVERLFAGPEQPEVLDLGQPGGAPGLYLADRGARVCIECFEAPDPAAAEGEPSPRIAIEQPDAKFDLVLAWEHGDFVPPELFADFAAEVRRLTAPGGYVVWFAHEIPHGAVREEQPARWRVSGDDRIVRLAGQGRPRPRWSYNTRTIERAVAPLEVQGVHLHRDRTREFLLRRPRT